MCRRVKRENNFDNPESNLGVGGSRSLSSGREGSDGFSAWWASSSRGAKKAWSLAESPAGQEGNCEAAARATVKERVRTGRGNCAEPLRSLLRSRRRKHYVEQKACDSAESRGQDRHTPAGRAAGRGWEQCAHCEGPEG